MRSWAGGILAMVALGATAGEAQARTYEARYELTGSLTVSWTGPEGTRGAVFLEPNIEGSVRFTGRGELRSSSASAFLFDPDPAVRVRRQAPDGAVSTCADRLSSNTPSLGFGSPRRGLEVNFLGEGFGATPALAGRCTGPLPADLAPLLPVARVPVGRLIRGPTVLRLGVRRAFAAGPIRGEVVSTLGVRFQKARSRPERRRRRPPRARVSQSGGGDVYRVVGTEGAVTTSYRGTNEPSCRLLDACGLEGTSTLRLLTADAEVPAGEVAIRQERFGAILARVAVEGRTSRSGAVTCEDRSEAENGGLHLVRTVRGEAVRFRLQPADSPFGADPVRTRCAGPAVEDLGTATLATGELPVSAFRDAEVRLVLRAAGSFDGGIYGGARGGEIVLTLRRMKAGADG